MEQKTKGIVWFRQDLRLHDNEALMAALRQCQEVIPVYVFDERAFLGTTRRFGFRKTGKFRAKFILECIEGLRRSIQALGSDLVVRSGKPEEVLFEIARQQKTNWVFCNRERTQEELKVQDDLEKNLWSVGQEIHFSRGKLLYHTADLPFPVTHTPDFFTQFKKEVERVVPVRQPFPSPLKMPPLPPGMEPGELPKLEDFGHEPFETDERAALNFRGGETAGLQRLHYYLWEKNFAATYEETRNQLVGGDFSTKFSPWLAQGCLSPKLVYHELQRYEQERGTKKSTYWIFFELLWRDFFRLMAKKHGDKIFLKGGMKNEPPARLKDERHLLQIWMNGRTGIPFIDANMRELSQTGYLSNRGRQNVASFLINDLKVNWQMGAEYFESILIDYDTASNWCNWGYIAGVGNDAREDRYFNILSQARRYDPHGEYVRLWLHELRNLPNDRIHRTDLLSGKEQEQFGVVIGSDYPKAMINMERWA